MRTRLCRQCRGKWFVDDAGRRLGVNTPTSNLFMVSMNDQASSYRPVVSEIEYHLLFDPINVKAFTHVLTIVQYDAIQVSSAYSHPCVFLEHMGSGRAQIAQRASCKE